MATSKKQSENGSKAASVSRTVKKPTAKVAKKTTTKKPTAKVAKKPTTKKPTTKTSTRKSTAKSAKPTTKKTTTKKTTKKPTTKSTRKSAKSTPNPHTVRPERYNNYPSRGPVTLTYRNPRARRDQQLTLWVHVDQAIHWMERGLWHHLTPMQEGCQVLHIGVGGRFIS